MNKKPKTKKPKTRLINGKRYKRREYAYDSESDAQKGAKSFRSFGQLVEVAYDNDRYGGSWYCYIRIPKHLRSRI